MKNKVIKIDLSEILSQEYVNVYSEIILNFRHCLLVCTTVYDKVNEKRFGIYYMISEFLTAMEIARSYGNENYEWSVNPLEIKKLYDLSDENIGEIEFEMSLYKSE